VRQKTAKQAYLEEYERSRFKEFENPVLKNSINRYRYEVPEVGNFYND